MIRYKQHSNKIFKIVLTALFIISLMLPFHMILNYEVVNTNGSHVCDVPEPRKSVYLKLSLVFLSVTHIIPFVLITMSNIAIVVRMSRINELANKYYSMNAKWSKNSTEESSLVSRSSTASMSININQSETMGILNPHCLILNKTSSNIGKEMYNFKLIQQTNHKVKGFKLNRINQKFYKTKILILITSFYVVSYFPYFLNFGINNYNSNSNRSGDQMYKAQSLTLLCEILFVCNYSISGFLLFAYGKIYRLHLARLVSRILNIFRKIFRIMKLSAKLNNFKD